MLPEQIIEGRMGEKSRALKVYDVEQRPLIASRDAPSRSRSARRRRRRHSSWGFGGGEGDRNARIWASPICVGIAPSGQHDRDAGRRGAHRLRVSKGCAPQKLDRGHLDQFEARETGYCMIGA